MSFTCPPAGAARLHSSGATAAAELPRAAGRERAFASALPGSLRHLREKHDDVADLLAVFYVDAPLGGLHLLEAVAVLRGAPRDEVPEGVLRCGGRPCRQPSAAVARA